MAAPALANTTRHPHFHPLSHTVAGALARGRAASIRGRAGSLVGSRVARSTHDNDTITIDHKKYNKYLKTFVTKLEKIVIKIIVQNITIIV